MGSVVLIFFFIQLSNCQARIDPTKQGELQGTLGSCALAGFALGNVGYSGLFYFVENQEWLIFMLGTIFSLLALLLICHYYLCVFDSNEFSVLHGNDEERILEEEGGTKEEYVRRRTSTVQMTAVKMETT